MFEPRGTGARDRDNGTLRRAIRNRRDWLALYDTRIANTIFCQTSDPPAIGARVGVDLLIHQGPRLHLQGEVTWRRLATSNQRMESGVRIRVSNAQRRLLDRVDDWLRSGTQNRRRHRRLPVRLRVTYSTEELRRRVNFVHDISRDGLFLSASQLAPLDSEVRLTVIPPDGISPQRLTGRVARCVEEADRRGMGIALNFDDELDELRYTELVEQLETRYIRGELGQRYLA